MWCPLHKIIGFLFIISLAVFLLLNKITSDLPAQCEDPHVFQLVCCGHYPQRTTESDIGKSKMSENKSQQN